MVIKFVLVVVDAVVAVVVVAAALVVVAVVAVVVAVVVDRQVLCSAIHNSLIPCSARIPGSTPVQDL